MAHFAEVDDNNNVLRTIVIANDAINNNDGTGDNEELGVSLAQQFTGSTNRWVQTSYNGSFRRQFPNRSGFTYDETLDVFIEPAPFASWSLDSDGYWQPPTPKPDDTETVFYLWNEDTLSWEEHPVIVMPTEPPTE